MSENGLCIFGEVLFDIFPDGHKVLGGAPFNVAWHAQAFGLAPDFISRVGNDAQGEQVIAAMRNWGMRLAGLQQDPDHPTGRVNVHIGADNEPAYDILADCAYDFIGGQAVQQAQACAALYHGTLALRNEVSLETLNGLKRQAGCRSFVDVNLRPPWWSMQAVSAQLSGARWVKLNTHELFLLMPDAQDEDGAIDAFMQKYTPELLIVTSGEAGALAVTDRGERVRAAPDLKHDVVDTVGAGDAFTSVILLGLLRSWPLELTMRRAQSFASAIVGVRGATVSDIAFYQPFTEAWELQ